MTKALIKLSFYHHINSTSASMYEREIFEDSWQEFLMQSQGYNLEGRHRFFSEMTNENPKANSMHYKVGFAVALYPGKLKGKIPWSKVGEQPHPPFASHEFRIIESNITDRLQHQVCMIYHTGSMTLLDKFGDMVLVAEGDERRANEWLHTYMVKLQPGVIISQYLPVINDQDQISLFNSSQVV